MPSWRCRACTATSVHYTNDTYATAHSLGRALVAGGSDTWFFVTVDYSFGYDLENETASVVKANGGKIPNGPMEVPGGDWIVNAMDPQGASFALHARKTA